MMTFVVFQNNFAGFKHIRAMDALTLSDAIKNITEGCVGCKTPSQEHMYYIYKTHQENVPVVGTRFNVYQFVKAVAGKNVEGQLRRFGASHEYALTHNSSMAWFFTDDIFGDDNCSF
jgi:hypothetical protein